MEQYVSNQGTLSSGLHHIATRRGRRLKRRSTFLPGVARFIAGEDKEEEENEGKEGRMQRSGAGWL
jgi:hypothetical protein